MVRRLNIDGDGQGDLAGYDGEHRAVLRPHDGDGGDRTGVPHPRPLRLRALGAGGPEDA